MGTYTLAGFSSLIVPLIAMLILAKRHWDKTLELKRAAQDHRLLKWEQGKEIYEALRVWRDADKLSRGDLDEIVALREDREMWNTCERFTQEEKLLLISAGYTLEIAEDALNGLGLESLKIQSALAK
jgi:hypothetical protein